MGTLVSYTCNEGVATIGMDDGKANAMSPAMQAELNQALDQARADKAIVVLAGRPGMFSAGFDLPTLMAGGLEAFRMLTGGFELAERLLTFPRPVIAACSGHALAMGVFLLASTDYVIAADGPFKIGANEVAIGLTMPRAAVEICRARLAPAHFNRAMMTSEIYRPADAIAAGLVDRVVAEADVLGAAQAHAASLAKLNMNAYAATKALVRAPLYQAMRAALEQDRALFRVICKVPD